MKRHLTLLTLIALTLLAAGCSKSEAPAERAGENIDQAINEGKAAVEETTEEAAKKIEGAGESMKQ